MAASEAHDVYYLTKNSKMNPPDRHWVDLVFPKYYQTKLILFIIRFDILVKVKFLHILPKFDQNSLG